MLVFYPYKNGSESIRKLNSVAIANRERMREVKTENSNYAHSRHHTPINWGRSSMDNEEFLKHNHRILNSPEKVALCSDKLKFFKHQSSLNLGLLAPHARVPNFTVNKENAARWHAEGFAVCERHKLNGHSADGLVIKEVGEKLDDAPLYTKYIPKKDEYRVHMYRKDGEAYILFSQRKAHKDNPEHGNKKVNWKVRNLDNGFVFQRHGLDVPADVLTQATYAFVNSGLDFGAVDVIYNQKHDKAYVLEINTAPGLTGESVAEYYNMLKEIAR